MEEYEGIFGDLGEFSDRVEMEDAQAVSIQEPTSIDRRNLMTHRSTDSKVYECKTSRPSRESNPGVVTIHQKKTRLRDRTDKAWFSRLSRGCGFPKGRGVVPHFDAWWRIKCPKIGNKSNGSTNTEPIRQKA